jgi:ribonucleotide monophosphatase NagD (HAD superfamily)
VSSIKEHTVLNRLGEKSFVQLNNQGIIIGIIEKQVVSDKFCVGGYKFESAKVFIDSFEQLQADNIKEIFVSNVIEQCLHNKLIFKESLVSKYDDVGTSTEWFEFNNKSTIFCDIDGTIIKAQSRQEMNDNPVPITENIVRLKEVLSNGSVIIFTTSRPHSMHPQVKEMLQNLGFNNFQLITGLPNTKRILINDYNEANPYPRAIAINIKRDNNNLSDFL